MNNPLSSDSESPPADSPDRWLDEHGDALFAYALGRVRKREIAEDLVQEALVAAVSKSAQFAGRSGRRTWLIGILRNKIMDHYRHARRGRSDDLRDPIAEQDPVDVPSDFGRDQIWAYQVMRWPSDPGATLMQSEFWAVFESCREKLPPRLFDAFALRELEQQGTDEICETLGIAPTNLAMRVYRARLMLRRCLEDHWFRS